MPTESSIEREFAELRKVSGFIDVPLNLWVPDEGAVGFDRLGKMCRSILGSRSRRLHEGLAPARFQGVVTLSSLCRKREARRWSKVLPTIGPTQLWNMIRGGLDEVPLAVRTKFRRGGRFDLVFAMGQVGSHEVLALASRRFSLAEPIVEHKWLRVTESSQNRGLAAQVIGALLPLYEMLGIYTVRITAGLSAGGAVWGKFGFVPDPEEWARIGPIIRTNIGAVMLQRGVSPTTYERCEAAAWLARQPDPKNLWLINDLKDEYSNDAVKLGTFLLRNVRWKGSLSFADNEAINRLRDRFKLSGVSLTALDSLSAAASQNLPRSA